MQAGRRAHRIAALAAVVVLAACGGPESPNLMNIRSSTAGPDEFAILPPKALQLPEDLAALPEPAPGTANRSDPTPLDDAIVALGGQLQAAGGIPGADAALYNHANRLGLAPGIRTTLASEDLEFRRNNNGRVLERLFDLNVYYRAYRRQSLDQQAELQRWRRAGARTPSAPPPEAAE